MLINEVELKDRIRKSIDYFKKDIKAIGTGKPNVEVIQNLELEAYGAMTTMQAVGQVIVEDAVTVKINVWDKSVLPQVEKALREADLGAQVLMDGDSIRLRFNPVTEEDRKDRVKQLKQKLEEGKIKVRQIRQDFKQELDSMEGVPEDDVKRDLDSLQKEIDSATDELDLISQKKEKELMNV